MELRDRVAIVTGSGRRVGRHLALALAGRGAVVAVHYNGSEDGARTTVREIEGAGGRAMAFQADLTEAAAPADLIKRVASTLGDPAVLVNSAAVMERTPFGEVSPERWDSIFALNLRAPFLLCQAAAPSLRRERGVIVNIADLAAFETWPGYIPHGLTKSGIVHMTRSLARIMAPDVRVNAIAPGTVLLPEDWRQADAERLDRTTPLARQGTPDDVSGALLFLLDAGYITGETIIVDGGRHVRK
jgi:pteridine reductase